MVSARVQKSWGEGAHSVNPPTMVGSLTVAGATRHERAFCSKQLQTASSGVGGRVVLARREPLIAGQSVLVKVWED
jgi:hypothetical protein